MWRHRSRAQDRHARPGHGGVLCRRRPGIPRSTDQRRRSLRRRIRLPTPWPSVIADGRGRKKVTVNTRHQIVVRFRDGSKQVFDEATPRSLHVGDRIVVIAGTEQSEGPGRNSSGVRKPTSGAVCARVQTARIRRETLFRRRTRLDRRRRNVKEICSANHRETGRRKGCIPCSIQSRSFFWSCGSWGSVSSYTMGGFIHILLVVAIVMVLVNLISGRRTL